MPNPWYLLLLRNSVFQIKSEYLTSLCKMIPDDLKVWFFVLGFQRNTQQQTRCYHKHCRIQAKVWPLYFYKCFKMHGTVCMPTLNDILILDQQWLPNQSDFPPISWSLYRAWPSPIISGFHGAFATGVACQQGTLTLPDTWFRPHCGTCLCSNCWDQIPRTCHVFTRLFT